MEKHTIKAVAFDMDGLMFDTEDLYWKAAVTLLGRRGKEYTQELNLAVMGRTPQFCAELFKETFSFPESWQKLHEESETLFLELLDDGFSTMPGLFELLELLEAKGIPKAVCTSSSARVAPEVLRRQNLASRFAFVLTAEDIRRGKPDPAIYLKAAARFGIEPGDMLVLEDSVAGCQSARQAGALPVVLLSEHNHDGDFSAAQWIVRRLDDPSVLALF